MSNLSVGSICSGIEAASVAWKAIGFRFSWFSEIADFPSRLLKTKYPSIQNLGDMSEIPAKIRANLIDTPDIICGGTPCQAFSLAGWKKGLADDRGNLTLKFVDIVDENDRVRSRNAKKPSIVFWENVEGVLRDKTNAFGCFLASLAGFDAEVKLHRWPEAGFIRGPKRNIAWRVLDAKYFGLPQQRRRLYVLAGGKDFFPENILFENMSDMPISDFSFQAKLTANISGHSVEVFRGYTDCLYSAYGTKWNGNAAAYNGSLFILQDQRLRRLTPLECERLMGFPDNYTNIEGAKPTNRYQSVGNSWAIPVISWIGKRILLCKDSNSTIDVSDFGLVSRGIKIATDYVVYDISGMPIILKNGTILNGSEKPERIIIGNILDLIDIEATENFYITPVGCKGILRRKNERGLTMNKRLTEVLEDISAQWSDEKIEKISRKQTRGKFSINKELESMSVSYSLFD